MKCIHCNSEWKTDEKIASSLTSCPFCGKSLAEKEELKSYDNSKDALAAIMRKFGPDVLLGRLNAYFSDMAPSVPQNIKKLVYDVYERGAAQILKRSLTSSQADKEIAIKLAIRQLTEAFIVPDMAETIIHEFVAALGWHMGWPAPSPEPPSMQTVTSVSNNAINTAPKIGSIIPFGSYKWRVLDVQGDKVLIITEYVIEKRIYNVKSTEVTWETCDLRTYLNGEFLQKFTKEQQMQIVETKNYNPDNLWYDTPGGSDTRDCIFLLDIEEADKYFGNSGDYQNKRSKKYVYGEVITDSDGYCCSNNYNRDRATKYMGREACWWWLRSPGEGCYNAALIGTDGIVNVKGYYVNIDDGGVRPALWLKV